MKLALIATLSFTMLTAQAGEKFGSIHFHSSVPKEQVEAMKADIKYLYNNPLHNQDSEFSTVSKLGLINGPILHNWLVNRVKHIIGAGFDMRSTGLIIENYVYPKTPVPKLEMGMSNLVTAPLIEDSVESEEAPEEKPESQNDDIKIIMSNTGGGMYLTGKTGILEKPNRFLPILAQKPKSIQVLYGLILDELKVFATSPRVGVIQVGVGLFHKDRAMDKKNVLSETSSIQRLGTFFHEARHSDGTGLSTSFPHVMCPVTHAFGGFSACERTTNGAYTIGALANKLFLKNCTTCTEKVKVAMQAAIADSLSRVLSGENAAKRIQAYSIMILQYQDVIARYQKKLATAKGKEQIELQDEILRLQGMLPLMREDIVTLRKDLHLKPGPSDDQPEGYYQHVSLESSMASMSAK